ncbi:hypothetical protein [Armatimonas sp.]|uniref:hypothetical protein n=1 Tax=Armatimonas sp. TaxID=1872638 RepID=UPI00374D28F0
MKQKNLCLSILIVLGLFSSLRAFWTGIPLVLGLDSVPKGTSFYNLFVVAGVWLAFWCAKRIPVLR